ncbi:MAG: glycosyltransferase family 9 protein [Nitrospiraceae bacterium]|nr:glycosyltransferase family 9 protein [Nitrospiraceae bacterium]
MIHPGSLGDVLLAVPAMVRVRTRFPDYRLALCAEAQAAKLLYACDVVDTWTSIQGRDCADLFVGADSVTGQMRTWLLDCDLAIGWTQSLDGTLSGTLKAFGVRTVIVRSPFSTEILAAHQQDKFLETIDEVPSEDDGDVLLKVTEPAIQLGRACLEAAGHSIGQSLVVIHPGSGSPHKCVAPETLLPVVVAVQRVGAIPVILEGPADREPVERLLQLSSNPPIILRDLDLLTVAGVLAQSQLFVGQDSGITHMAGLMGVHMVALFGPTDPARWAPRGIHMTVVQGASCLCRSWDEVSRCKGKPCLDLPTDDLVALCLTRLDEAAIRRRIPSGCLVTDYPVC